MSIEDVDPEELLEKLQSEEAESLKQKLIDRVNLLTTERYINREAIAFIGNLLK